jgi:hypothetical protein
MIGCTGASPGGIPVGTRLFTGQLVAPSPSDLGSGRPSPAFQLVGTHDAMTIFFGEPFDPNTQSGGSISIPFRLQAPCDQTVSLHVQRIGTSSGSTLGEPVALLQFPRNASETRLTSLVAWEKDCGAAEGREIKLGTIQIDFGARRVTLPGDAGGQNPLTQVVTLRADGEQMSNFDNPDDDGDGIPDAIDTDEDGDGIPDAMQGITSFLTF